MITYSHDIYCNGTFSIELPEKKYLKQILDIFSDSGLMRIGYSRCSEMHFKKKIGREIADKRMDWRKTKFRYLDNRGQKHVYHFEVDIPEPFKNTKVEFGLSMIEKSDFTQLVYAEFLSK